MNENEQEQEIPEQETGGNAEAKRYRLRLREVESERDQLKEQVQHFRRAEAERHAANHLDDPSDLWRAGVHLGELLEEGSGELDEDKLSETVQQVATEHPSWRKRPDGVDHDQGRASEAPTGASWSGLLRSAAREK